MNLATGTTARMEREIPARIVQVERKILDIKRMTDAELYFFARKYESDFYKNIEGALFNDVFPEIIDQGNSGFDNCDSGFFKRIEVRVFGFSELIYSRVFLLPDLSLVE